MSATGRDDESREALRERRRAIAELGAVLRELDEAAVSTEVDTETLLQVAERARECVAPLTAAARTRTDMPSADSGITHRTYNPASGRGNPIAPPMHVEIIDGFAVGTCTLGLIYEGPPRYTHGGISAMLLDQILGHAHATQGRPGMTVKLSAKYRKPVPLQTPLRITGWLVDAADSGRSGCKATITTADEPDVVLVEGEGTFIQPRPEQARKLFGESASWARTLARE